MKRTETQFRTRARIINTKEGKALGFGFRLGPISVYVIANLPNSSTNQEGPLVYIKMDLRGEEGWQITE